jgi:KaiC/GvpD/RAD55 family RecA-like ATPase
MLVRESRAGKTQQIYLELSRPRVRCHILTQGLDLEILGELAPGAFHYGMTCVIEFEPHSLWHEVSLTITAEALKHGIKTEYHVFQHTPSDIRAALKEMGVDVEKFEERGSFRIWDSYTPTTLLKANIEGKAEPMLSGKSPDLQQWTKAIREKMEHGFEEEEKRWLHIDDNEAILLQFNDEEYVTKGWRTIFLPMVKSRQLITFHAFVTGMASQSFYNQRESVADAVIDIVTREEQGRLEHYIRLRALRGMKFDSSWRRIELFDKNRVKLVAGRQVFGFESKDEEKIFDCLLKSFVEDYYDKKQPLESSGWRSMVEIAKAIGERATSLYSARSSVLLGDLIKRGVAERKYFSKQRGRGGSVTRMRIAYEKAPVKEFVDRYMEK